MIYSLGAAAAFVAVRVLRGGGRSADAHSQPRAFDPVEIESDDSFPASDPPSHTSTTGATVRPPGIH
jgi:hypothetical protein